MLYTQARNYSAIAMYKKLGYTFVPGTKDFEKEIHILKDLAKRKG
ncbi:hypothetical protein TMUPMC115_0122 [Tetragenococcus muriaticus PMC-11-5]|uniref:GNAT family acetyltransferase n=1 Tax=Tetragenococcus muriaticus PMC-11-5 TaxID=1302649 RepID=A0A091C9C9_9ENTE|nr:hypothetical protein TMUPMC115_0122 [Tetragenococcus muriaticus PMC-11-5]